MQSFATGSERIFYKAVNFQTGLTVTAYLWSPILVQSALQTLTEISDGLYYLDYNFDTAGPWPILFMEGGVKVSFAVMRVTALNDLSTVEVNAEIVDALNADTYAEPGQGTPSATATLAAKIGYLYKAFRNRLTQTTTTLSIYDDAGAVVDQKATVSDDGTTYTRGEIISGP